MKSNSGLLALVIALVLYVLHLSDVSYKQETIGNTYSELIYMKTQCESIHKTECKVGFTMIATSIK